MKLDVNTNSVEIENRFFMKSESMCTPKKSEIFILRIPLYIFYQKNVSQYKYRTLTLDLSFYETTGLMFKWFQTISSANRSCWIAWIIGFLLVACRVSCAPWPNSSSPHDRTIAAFPDIVCALPSVTDGMSAVGHHSSAKVRPARDFLFDTLCAILIIGHKLH